jgi:hypothetical protein
MSKQPKPEITVWDDVITSRVQIEITAEDKKFKTTETYRLANGCIAIKTTITPQPQTRFTYLPGDKVSTASHTDLPNYIRMLIEKVNYIGL